MLFAYTVYYYELKCIYSNDLILDRLNLNNTRHQISLHKANGIWCNFFKLLVSYVIFTNSYFKKAIVNSLLKKSFFSSNSFSTKRHLAKTSQKKSFFLKNLL